MNKRGWLLKAAVSTLILLNRSEGVKGWSRGNPNHDRSRRLLVESLGAGFAGLVGAPVVASAGEVGARVTQAVTKSDLGISVRRSVVQGAQTMDSIDGQWERFSDKFGLGSARNNRDKLPPPKVIPEPLPLDEVIATKLLELSDQAFLAATNLTNLDQSMLSKQVDRVAETVQASFERSGEDTRSRIPSNGGQFNFLSYVHFKAYSDIIIDRKLDFRSFKRDFEGQLGEQIIQLLLPDLHKLGTLATSSATLKSQLKETLGRIDQLKTALIKLGLVSLVEVSTIDAEVLNDWSEDLADLQWSVVVDGDVTLQAQILLQEQGFRLYPNFARYGVQALLYKIVGQTEDVSDYYVDTDYNSDPDKFDPKEVLLNIVLESR